MDVLEHSLDGSAEDGNDEDHMDQNVGQQISYRVIHLTEGADCEGIMATAVLQPSQQVGQGGVLQSPYGGASSSPHGDGVETRFTYVPANSNDGDSAGTAAVLTTSQVAPVGQFYVMMSPQDVLPNQRGIAPRTPFTSSKSDGQRGVRDDRRRSTHNEVERRRRDKINNWIVTLSKLIPDYMQEHPKQAPVGPVPSTSTAQSKGGILAKACDYINDLRKEHMQLNERIKDIDRINLDNDVLRQQVEELKQENSLLRAQLQQHNILLDSDVTHNGT